MMSSKRLPLNNPGLAPALPLPWSRRVGQPGAKQRTGESHLTNLSQRTFYARI